MNWIDIKDKSPREHDFIVAIMDGRREQSGDPFEDAYIVILRNDGTDRFEEWRNMDGTDIYYLPSQNGDYYKTIRYWKPWQDFGFPESMLIGE